MLNKIILILSLTGCSTSSSLCHFDICEKDRQQLYNTCLKSPETLGYPVPTKDWSYLKSNGWQFSQSPMQFCRDWVKVVYP